MHTSPNWNHMALLDPSNGNISIVGTRTPCPCKEDISVFSIRKISLPKTDNHVVNIFRLNIRPRKARTTCSCPPVKPSG